MAEHARERPLLFFSKREELRRVITNYIAIERYIVRDPETIEDGEQQQLVFDGLSYRIQLDRSAIAPSPEPPWFRRRHAL